MAIPFDNLALLEAWRRHLRLGVALSVMTIGQLASSFGIQWYTVAQLGAGPETDALYAGATLPQIVMVVMIQPLGFVLTPMLSVRSESDRRAVVWLVFWFVAALCTFIALVLVLLAPLLVPWLAPGFSKSTVQLTVELTRIQMVGAVGAGCEMVVSSLYHAGHRFVRPALSMLLSSLVGWAILIMGIRYGGVTLAAWVQVLTFAGPILLLVPSMGRFPSGDLSKIGEILGELWRQVRPLMANAAYYRTGFVVDRFLTSLLAPGSVVVLELVLRIHTGMVRIFNVGVTTPLVPLLATLSSQGSWPAFKKQYRDRLLWLSLLSLGAVMTLMTGALLAYDLFQGNDETVIIGTLRSQDINKLVMTLLGGSGVLLFGSINHLLMSAFYAHGDTNTPAKIQMLTYSIGMVMKFGGFIVGGLLGITVAISVSYALEGILLGSILHRRVTDRLRSQSQPSVELPTISARPL